MKPKTIAHIEINTSWCKGCYFCIELCPKRVFEKGADLGNGGFAPVVIKRPEDCTRCMLCEFLCPDLAIKVS